MYIACSTLCFGRVGLEQALRTIHEMHFQKVDLAIHERGAHLKPSDVAADVNRQANLLRASGMSFAAFHLEIDAPDAERYREQMRSVCRLARLLSVPVVNIAAALAGSDFDAEVQRLTGLNRLAESEGVILTVETNRETLTADPAGAAELCRRVSGLGLTLDPSHYLVGPHPHPDHEELYEFVRHVRLRDTAADRLQVCVGQGQVEYGKIVSLLEREHYDRALSVDIRDTPEVDYPLEPEVRKLKYLLESMV